MFRGLARKPPLMTNHRRKLALLAALALLFGSAAASAANYANGKSARPTLGGAGDALGMALGGAVNASAWMASRTHNAVDQVLAYLRPSSTAPAEVATPLDAVPRARSGSHLPTAAGTQHTMVSSPEQPDRAHPASFEGVRFPLAAQRTPAVDVTLSALPGASGGGVVPILRVADVIPALPAAAAPIPEPETYALFAAGLALIGGVARRRGKARAA